MTVFSPYSLVINFSVCLETATYDKVLEKSLIVRVLPLDLM